MENMYILIFNTEKTSKALNATDLSTQSDVDPSVVTFRII